jgi:hypothetical protein
MATAVKFGIYGMLLGPSTTYRGGRSPRPAPILHRNSTVDRANKIENAEAGYGLRVEMN